MASALKKDAMSVGFAVFNCHINRARVKATEQFIETFGRKRYDRHIGKYDDGIMDILNRKPNQYQMAWIMMVTVLVNEKRG